MKHIHYILARTGYTHTNGFIKQPSKFNDKEATVILDDMLRCFLALLIDPHTSVGGRVVYAATRSIAPPS